MIKKFLIFLTLIFLNGCTSITLEKRFYKSSTNSEFLKFSIRPIIEKHIFTAEIIGLQIVIINKGDKEVKINWDNSFIIYNNEIDSAIRRVEDLKNNVSLIQSCTVLTPHSVSVFKIYLSEEQIKAQEIFSQSLTELLTKNIESTHSFEVYLDIISDKEDHCICLKGVYTEFSEAPL